MIWMLNSFACISMLFTWTCVLKSILVGHYFYTADSRSEGERGILVVPGLGRPDRLQVVYDNIMTLLPAKSSSFSNTHSITWDCVIYVYTSRKDAELWSWSDNSRKWEELARRCDIVENIGKKVTENMHMLQPTLLRQTYQYVFILLDDIKAPSSPKSILQLMVDILKCNKLTVLSPMVRWSLHS